MRILNKIIFISLVCFAATSSVFASITPSRNSGVAPLYVHVTASAGMVSSSSGNMPFHDYEYSWNFGDATSGTWGTSDRSKNTDKGPVAAHVYDSAGTYTITLTVRNSSGTVIETSTEEIEVTNPDTVFSGTNTTCVSSTTDFTGCPTGSAQVTTTDLGDLSSYTGAGSRVLLRRGSSWTVGSNINFPNNAGPVHIGAFGTCSTPDDLGICSNAPQVTTGVGVEFLNVSNKSDWRLTDISFPNASTSDSFLTGGQNPRNILAYKISTTGMGAAIDFTSYRESDEEYIDGIAIVSSRFLNAYAMTIWMGGERLAFIGNIVGDPVTSHAVRIWYSYQGVISHNIIYGAGDELHELKLHGPTPQGYSGQTYVGTYAEVGSTGVRHLSEFTVISDNVFGGNYPWVVSIAPQNAGYDERVSDVLFEKNRILMDYETTGAAGDTPIDISAMYVTARNNIIDATGGDTYVVGIHAYKRGVEFSTALHEGIRIYNNTFYSQTNHTTGIKAIRVHDTVLGAVVANNYASFPNTSVAVVLEDLGVNTISSNNAITTAPGFADPMNVNPLYRDFSTTESATASIDQGYSVPVLDDYLGNSRVGLTYDLGAFEYGAGVPQYHSLGTVIFGVGVN